MRWPQLSRRLSMSRSQASLAKRSRRNHSLEALEPRQMLALSAGPGISDAQLIGMGRFEVALEKAADLSRYSSAELDNVAQWISFTPEYYARRNWILDTAPLTNPPTGSGTTTNPSNVPSTEFSPSTFVGPITTDSPGTLTPGTISTPQTSTLGTVASIDRFPGAQLWTFPANVHWQDAAAEMRSAVGEGQFYPLVGHTPSKKLVPNDPHYPQQWHLDNRRQSNGIAGEDANVIEVWDQYRGTNVMIGIVDDGIDFFHNDILPSLSLPLSADYSGLQVGFGGPGSADPFNEDYHGTAVAGIAASPGNNNIGISGVAPDADIASIRLISNPDATDFQEALALSHAPQDIDIYNNSWGPVDGIDWLRTPGPLTLGAIVDGTDFGRNGRGSIYTWAAGNGLQDDDNVNYDGYANFHLTIAVTAVDDRGRQTEYSEPGAAILISAPSSSGEDGIDDGMVSTDISGGQGYNYVVGDADDDNFRDLDYTSTMGGTSGATPVVSGVVALMLEANPNLGWRDVQSILVETARKNDPNDNGWIVNAAGYDFNPKYGFGVVDAGAAVTLADSWTNLGPLRNSLSGRVFSGLVIPENTTGATSTINVPDDFVNIEFVEVLVDINHNFGGDLEMVLTSPSGTRSLLTAEHNDATPYEDWFMVSNAFRGEATLGEWKLTIYDRDSGVTGTLDSWALNIYAGPDVAPVAVNDTAQTRPGVPVTIAVTANDANRPDVTTVALVGNPSAGTATVGPTGIITYTPPAGFSGDATLQYTVESQGGLVSNTATVTIVVNEPPTARPDAFSTPEDFVATFNVAINDTDIDGTVVPSSVTITTGPTNGTASVDAQGRIVYTPTLNYFGSDSLQYTIRDNRGGTSQPGAVTITVTPVNDAPTPVDDTGKGVGGVATIIDVVANDFDIDSAVDPATVQIVTPPPDGTAIVNASGTITVTPPLGFAGVLTFTYAVRDTQGALSTPGTVRITTSAPPTTVADSATINEDTPITIDVLFNDFDVDDVINRSSLAIATQPQHGTVTIDASQRIRYVPAQDYFGTDTFQYRVRDSEGNTSAPGTVTITIIEVNDAPRGGLDAAGTDMNTGIVIEILDNDIDIDGRLELSTLNIPVGGRPQHGTASVDIVTGTIFYEPNTGYIGSDALTYLIRDEDGALSNEIKVLLRVGRPVSFTGTVFADINNNGLLDNGEIGVPNTEVAAVMNAGLFQLSATVRTENDGTFTIVDRPSEGVVLPQGTYTLRQPQPVAFIDGKDTPGTPPPGATINNAFVSITLDAGETAETFLFGERGLKAEFVSAYLGRRLYFASAAPDVGLFGGRHGRVFNLADGEVYFTFDGGAPGRVTASATFDTGSGNAKLEVLDANLAVLSTANSTNGQASVSFGPGPGPYILRVSGSASNVLVTSQSVDTTPRVGATLSLRGSQWPLQVVDSISTPGTASTGMTLSPASASGEGVLPWSNVDTISVRFDSPVSIGANALHLASASGQTYTVAGYFYDSITRTATWRLDRPLAADNYVVSVTPAGSPVDFHLSTNAPGEARFSVLPGDVNGDGVANFVDAIAIRNNFAAAGQYTLSSPRYDLDASGNVDMADLVLALRNGFTKRSVDEVSGLLVNGSTSTTSSGAPEAGAVVATANVAARRESSSSRSISRNARIAAIDASHETAAPGISTTTLRASRARRIAESVPTGDL
jgi:subtilisin-like proprotein convertase family protein